MDKKQIRGAVVLLVATFVVLGAVSMAGRTDATGESAGGVQVLTGSGQGYASQITVEVTMDGDTITGIEVVESDDTPGLSDGAFDAVIEAVLANQTAEGVDMVSGATGSSEGVLNAIKEALASATGESAGGAQVLTGSGQGYASQITVEVTMDGDTITGIEVVESDDTPGLSDGAFDAVIEAVLANQSAEGVDMVSGATGSSEGILNAIKEALAGI
ncbi:FMN-binding protein [Anoxynatronum sibiricum]|uniref:FMN-binding protein n=1 Tax=Anoxynatronum sibiricum TaxID=210623 RepID=A0ABU9VS74_9CLOT